MPTSAEKPNESATASGATATDQPASFWSSCDPPTPRSTPIAPPRTQSMSDSIRNWSRMSRRRAPSALRRPISRVRSVTETSMMFMIPIPPTRSEIAAIPASRNEKVFVVSCTVLTSEA